MGVWFDLGRGSVSTTIMGTLSDLIMARGGGVGWRFAEEVDEWCAVFVETLAMKIPRKDVRLTGEVCFL